MNKINTSGYLITSDQHKIHYDHYKAGHNKVIIIAHGFFNSKQTTHLTQLAQSLNNDYDVISFDFRGHGRSKGLFYWTAREYLDLLSVVDLASKAYGQIGVVGFSLGAATSIIAGSKTKLINSIIAISAPVEVVKIDYHFWKLDVKHDLLPLLLSQGRYGQGARPGPFWLKKENPVNIVKKIETPILYIHGDSDWTIRHWHSEELYKHTASVKRINIIKNGPHAEHLLRSHKVEMLALIREWFHETLG